MKKILTLAITCCVMMLAKSSSAAIHGTLGACVGSTSTLFDSSSSGVMGPGTWSSSNVAIATVGATTGVVTGVSAGTATITFVGTTGTSTAVFTVSPVPAAITGGTTPFCAGTSVTLTSATPGGTWTGGSGILSVGSTTGVVTGTGAGTAYVHYVVGPGCYASTVVTVIGTPAVDSLTGPSSVCIGGTATYACTTAGGTWSTSSTAIATISAAGVLTGVSGGTVIISYSVSGTCGTGVRTRAVTVAGSTITGTITGTTSVATGFTTSLYNSVSGGTWSSSNPAVATISASGVVTGVAVGTTVISYAVSGCSGLAYATTTVTVTAANCISGNVLFTAGAAYYGPVRVWLIKYNPGTLMLTAVDSTYVYASGTSVGYSFCGMGTDSFRVKAACDSTSTPTMGYLPTYHTSSAFWNTATVINHVSGTHDINKNITMAYGAGTTGPGFIGGSVTAGANKGTAEGDPVVNQLVYCINDATGAILQQTYTNSLGQYSFSNLPTGATYKVYPELMNFTTTPYPTISLTSSSSSVTAASFRKNTLPKTITPITSGIAEVNTNNAGISVYPNPAKGAVNVSWNIATTGTATITVSDVTGRIVLSTTADMTSANGTTKVDVSMLNAGMYLISVKNNGVNYNTKVSIQ